MTIQVSQLVFYPVKSCAGTTLEIAKISDRGIEHDREWLIVDAKTNVALTQREVARMCLIKPSVHKTSGTYSLSLAVEGMPDIHVPLANEGKRRVKVWSSTCTAHDQGDSVAAWLSSYLARDCRLVRMAPDYVRRVDQRYAKRKTDQTGFADEFPLLLISEESLQDLNSHLVQALPMDRFRPNIVVKGTAPYSEDDWKLISINHIEFDVLKPCARCVITTIDQSAATKGVEPLQTLATMRKVRNKVMFGMNIAHHSPGQISIGDEVELVW